MNRYDKYKSVSLPWVNEIPEHWEIIRNKNIFMEKKKSVGSQFEKYKLLSLSLKGVIERNLEDGGKFPASFEKYTIVNPKDLVFCLFDIDETPRTIGISKIEGMITSAYNIMAVKKDCARYMYYFYLYLDFIKGLKPYYSSLRKTVNIDTFNSFKILIPPINEQEQIANYLDWKINEIDRLIKVEKEKQILVKNIFNNELKRKYISLRKYNMVSLKRICTIFSGKEVVDEINFKEGAIPVYGSGSIVFKYTSNVMLDGKFIIFGRKGTIGKPYIVNNKFWLVDTAYAAKNNDLVTFDYLFYLLRILNWEEFTTNTVKPSIVANQVIQTKIKLPVIEEQNTIMSDINSYEKNVNTILEFISKKIKELELLKQSLISEVVTGKIDVRNVVIPEYEKVTLLDDEIEEFDETEGIEDGD